MTTITKCTLNQVEKRLITGVLNDVNYHDNGDNGDNGDNDDNDGNVNYHDNGNGGDTTSGDLGL
jgi:hypothetical protein